jgi:hypothetical protein
MLLRSHSIGPLHFPRRDLVGGDWVRTDDGTDSLSASTAGAERTEESRNDAVHYRRSTSSRHLGHHGAAIRQDSTMDDVSQLIANARRLRRPGHLVMTEPVAAPDLSVHMW